MNELDRDILQMVFDKNPVPLALVDLEGPRVLSLNAAGHALFVDGIDDSTLKSLLECVSDQDEAMCASPPHHFKLKRQDLEAGRIVLCFEDRSAHEIQTQALKRSENLFQTLTNELDIAIWVRDAKTFEVIYMNPTFARSFLQIGYSLEEFASDDQALLKMVHPADRHIIASILEDPSQELDETVIRVIQKNGKERAFRAKSSVTKDAEGTPLLYIGLAQDITEERDIAARLSRQAALLNHTTDAIIEMDLKNRVRFWNQAAERLYGITTHEARGRLIQEVLRVDDDIFKTASKKLNSDGTWTGEFEQTDANGNQVWVTARWNRYGDGENEGFLLIHTDVSEWKRLQAQFMRAQRLESIGNIASGMAHDLNNLLTPILMSADLLATDSEDPFARTLGENIKTSAKRGAEIIKQVLYFARGVEGQKLPINVERLLKDLRQIVRDTFPRSIAAEFELKELPRVLGDATQLQQVLLNLLVNARDAMIGGGRLGIRTYQKEIDHAYARMVDGAHPGVFVVVEISDTGHGIPENLKAQIFEPFVTTKEMGSGTGLGLSTALAIVRSHGGFINFDSSNRGTIFRVYLPIAEDDVESGTDTPIIERPRAIHGKGATILFVDDEPAIVEIAASTLERHGFKVITASNGAEAVALFARHKETIKAVISDISMPVMSGPDAMKAIRAICPEVPLIAISGGVQRTSGLSEIGVIAEIQKPFHFQELLETTIDAIEGKKE